MARGRNGTYDSEAFLKSFDLLRDMTNLKDAGTMDKTDPQSVQQRIEDYFQICIQNGTRPLVSGFATMLGLRRKELLQVLAGQKNMGFAAEAIDVVQYYYNLLEVSWDYAMNNGGIDRVCGIFLGKNNFGYADQQEVIHVDNRASTPALSMDELAKQIASLPPKELESE
ncbi:MAG: hypothetical protein Q4F79_12525 [Eubacteriales bacterium]|nr:hypothetical protein [Eubacteriales bacterium]